MRTHAGNAAGKAFSSGGGRNIAVLKSRPIHEGAAACVGDVGVWSRADPDYGGRVWRGSARLGARATCPPTQKSSGSRRNPLRLVVQMGSFHT